MKFDYLVAENFHLKVNLDQLMDIYKNQLYELVALKTKMDLLRDVIENEGHVVEKDIKMARESGEAVIDYIR